MHWRTGQLAHASLLTAALGPVLGPHPREQLPVGGDGDIALVSREVTWPVLTLSSGRLLLGAPRPSVSKCVACVSVGVSGPQRSPAAAAGPALAASPARGYPALGSAAQLPQEPHAPRQPGSSCPGWPWPVLLVEEGLVSCSRNPKRTAMLVGRWGPALPGTSPRPQSARSRGDLGRSHKACGRCAYSCRVGEPCGSLRSLAELHRRARSGSGRSHSGQTTRRRLSPGAEASTGDQSAHTDVHMSRKIPTASPTDNLGSESGAYTCSRRDLRPPEGSLGSRT